MQQLRLVFMGTPEFSVPSLEALLEAGHDVCCVYTQPPRPAGRGHAERRSPVHCVAEECGIPVRTPRTLHDDAALRELAALKPDVVVVVAYGLILPQAVLDIPRLGCVNVHASLLPRWRGAAPIQRAILAGDRETGVTIMMMDVGLDTGPVLLERRVPITRDTTAQSLHDELSEVGAELLVPALEGLALGTLKSTPQPDAGATYATKLSREEGRIDWAATADEIDRRVRAFTPWPGTWFDYAGERVKVLQVALVGDVHNVSPGVVLDAEATIACGQGAVRLIRVQRPGRAATSGAEFLRGSRIGAGDRLVDRAQQ